MKNKIQTVKYIFFILLFILGFNAFTRPNQDSIDYDFVQGKLEAAQLDSVMYAVDMAKKDHLEMTLQFDDLASEPESDQSSTSHLSDLSQIIYIYEQRLSEVEMPSITSEQRYALLNQLKSLKAEFLMVLSSPRQ
ncbi:MAG: hypothetical protein JNL11_10030 [Bdellovibrionaceae bacterium]|nr:hypothetical protein [Pseudobdellovibrionaceae bacterium]